MNNDYSRAIDYLYSQTPQFQQIGAAAYKPGLGTVKALAEIFGNPQQRLRCIHVAGTNGKGSTSHSLAAVLQSAGYKVGLFTSPHLVDFRERIRINGYMISREEVASFVDRYIAMKPDGLEPSFFELTTMMAFEWFAANEVDFAVIEVGLGGRLDSTNIITPILSVITNISFDHMAQLGNTLTAIAGEKAGIIKPGVPVVAGESEGDVRRVFASRAKECGAPIYFADTEHPAKILSHSPQGIQADTPFGKVNFELTGLCQEKNLQTIIEALVQLRASGVRFGAGDVAAGLARVEELTGLRGRWMVVGDNPLIVCDTGHNEGGWRYLSRQIAAHQGPRVCVLGFVNDKDLSHILPMLPRDTHYIFTRASVPRALPARELAEAAAGFGIPSEESHTTACTAPDVQAAMSEARALAAQLGPDTLIFVGGSTFVVADLMAMLDENKL